MSAIIPIITAFLTIIIVYSLKKHSIMQILERIKNEFNLKFNTNTIFSKKILSGKIYGKDITISTESGSRKTYLNINIYHKLDIQGEFKITKESTFSKIKKTAGFFDDVTLDEAFDDKMLLSAYPVINLTAMMNKLTRENILKIAEYTDHLEITKNMINFKIPLGFFSMGSGSVDLIKTAVSISNNMTEKKSIKQRLIENIRNTKNNISIRTYNIQMLVNNFPDDKYVYEVLKSLLEDKSDDIRVTAASCLKEEGMEFLLKLLQKQIKSKSIINSQIILILGNTQYSKAIPELLEIYKRKDIPALKILILISLNNIGDPSVNDFLVKQLTNEDNKLRDEAIKALASCGIREAIEPLCKLNKKIFSPATKNLIQETIGKIQSRLGCIDMGALSIAEHFEKDGALSISDEVTGRLSLTDEDKRENGLSHEGGL
ncbi:MAG: HEAT repeat domain-containing protein [Spirochaetes bacterium]|nr:HEAT repeat domain-containing protein [Spirochaetota bacterium]